MRSNMADGQRVDGAAVRYSLKVDQGLLPNLQRTEMHAKCAERHTGESDPGWYL